MTAAIEADTRFAEGDIRQAESGCAPANPPPRLALATLINSWTARKQATPAQICLAWLLAQRPWLVPIPGTSRMARMQDKLGAAHVRATPAEVAELNQAVAAIRVQGARLPDAVQVYSGVQAPLRERQ